jgi:hypothetical protein
MTICRITKVSEVRRWCKEMRENPALLLAIELKAKEMLYKRFLQKEKTASA